MIIKRWPFRVQRPSPQITKSGWSTNQMGHPGYPGSGPLARPDHHRDAPIGRMSSASTWQRSEASSDPPTRWRTSRRRTSVKPVDLLHDHCLQHPGRLGHRVDRDLPEYAARQVTLERAGHLHYRSRPVQVADVRGASRTTAEFARMLAGVVTGCVRHASEPKSTTSAPSGGGAPLVSRSLILPPWMTTVA